MLLKLINNSSSYFSVYSLVLILIAKIYQTLDTMFHHISKYLKFRQKYATARSIFNSLLGVWKSDETLSLAFDKIIKAYSPT